MAGAHDIRFLRAAIAAIVLVLAPAAHAVVYKWVEEDGKVIYSNEPPPDPGKVSELTRIDDLQPADLAPREPVTLIPREPVTLAPRESAPAQREVEAPPPRIIPRSTHTGAVQDPCLVSPDPRCHERNKGNYHPSAGYVPPSGAVPQQVGTTAGAGAGGAVGGQVPAPPSAVVPPKQRGVQALPPGSTSLDWSKPVR
jgi:hypothetical protein